jgi:hypothetical protein
MGAEVENLKTCNVLVNELRHFSPFVFVAENSGWEFIVVCVRAW